MQYPVPGQEDAIFQQIEHDAEEENVEELFKHDKPGDVNRQAGQEELDGEELESVGHEDNPIENDPIGLRASIEENALPPKLP